MRKFEKNITVGNYVKIAGIGWDRIKEIHDSRKFIKLEKYLGSFQRNHVLQYTKFLTRTKKQEN